MVGAAIRTAVAGVLAATALVAPAAVPAVAVTPAVTVSGDASTYALSTTRAGNRTVTARWNPCQAAITVKVNPALAGSTAAARSAAVADVRTALERLSAATGMRFVYTGTTRYAPTGDWAAASPAEVVVAWVNPRTRPASAALLGRDGRGAFVAGTGGYASKSWSYGGAWSAAIGRGFVVINAAQASAFRPGFGAGVTRGSLLLHELGHVVGLGHVGTASQVMYGVIVSRPAAGYRSGDLAGLARVGARAGCISVPAFVWPDL